MWLVFDAVLFAAGYAASIHSWARIRSWIIGARAEIARLEARIAALKASL